MDKLQKIFDSQLTKLIDEKIKSFLSKILKNKLSQQGIKLSEENLSEFAEKIRVGEKNINFDIDDISDKVTVKNIKIDLSDADTKKFIKDFKSKIEKSIPTIITDTSKSLFNDLKKQAVSHVRLLRADSNDFQTRLEKRWSKPFTLLEIYLALVFEVGFDLNREYRENCVQNPDKIFDVLIRLHARASQITLEIITLIKAGLADGAHARWRTLHEIAVVSQFINKHGKDVAERYNNHNFVESYKGSLQYQQYAEALHLKKIPKKEMDEITKNYNDSLSKYGINFKEQYGWASAALNKLKPTFADVENDVDMDKWRPYYKMASHNVHANPKGITFKLGLSDKKSQILLAGVSDTGFADPAHGTAISLLQITSTILLTNPNIDKLVTMSVLKQFERLIGDEFLKTQFRYDHTRKRKN